MVKDSYYRLVSRGVQEQRLLDGEEDCRFFLTLLAKFRERFSIQIPGYCLMPDQVHLIVQCEDSRQLSFL